MNQKNNYQLLLSAQETWQTYFNQIPRSNLLQTWAYGEAKAATEHWLSERWIIFKNQEPIALLQTLKKSFLGLWTLVRINQGPLWFNEEMVSHEDKQTMFKLIRKNYGWSKRCLLLIMPNLLASQQNQQLLRQCFYYSRKKENYVSIWLDLSQTENDLRKALRSNWRGQLVKSEKIGLLCEISNAKDDLPELLMRYQLLQKQKNFRGISQNLLKQLIESSDTPYFSSILFKARFQGELIAGVLIISYGLSCVYLVGWFDRQKGQGTNAMNFLLWQAILEMKRRGCKWLDLGGISQANAALASIASFKRGLQGEEYELLGEYLTF